MALVAATEVSAVPVLVRQPSPGYGGRNAGGEFNISPNFTGASYGLDVAIFGGFETFCIQSTVNINVPGTYDAVVSQSDSVGNPLSKGTAWLYQLYAAENAVLLYDYNPFGTRTDAANELQQAIWILQGQSGQHVVDTAASNGYVQLAAANFGSLANALAPNNGALPVSIVILVGTNGIPGQNMLALDPNPKPLPAAIGNFIWEDSNSNGVQDATEPGIAGATVTLTDCGGNAAKGMDGNPVNPIVTGANGFYQFTNLAAGQYKIIVTLPGGYVFTQQFQGGDVAKDSNVLPATGESDCRTLVAGQYDDTVDAGAYKPAVCTANLCGSIFADCDGSGDLSAKDVGLKNILVKLVNAAGQSVATTTTDTNGTYCFGGLVAGNYKVVVTPPTGYKQTGASSAHYWKDSYGRKCWVDNDDNAHCVDNGTECWRGKDGNVHWKDSSGRDCWKDSNSKDNNSRDNNSKDNNDGNSNNGDSNNAGYHCQPVSYKTCNSTNNNTLCVTLTNCQNKLDVNFAYTGTTPNIVVCVSGPSTAKCGQPVTYTCSVTNTGNVCFKGGTICHTIGNCGYYGWSGTPCTYTVSCPPLSPGEHCEIKQTCTFNSWNVGNNISCQTKVTCNQGSGSGASGQSSCNTRVSW